MTPVQAAPPPDRGRRDLWIAVGLALLAWGGAVVRGGFSYDDREAIVGNPVVEGTVPAREAFRRDYWHHLGDAGHYRPLATLALRADRRLWGDASRGFHLTNALLHAAVVLIAGLVLRRLGAGAPWSVGLWIFACHPVLADSVAWVSGRTSMVAALGGSAALLASAAAPRASLAGLLAGLLLFLGLCGKEDALVFGPPAFLIACNRSPARALSVVLGGTAAVALWLLLRAEYVGSALPHSPHAPLAALSFPERLPFGGRALLEGVRALVWPLGLSPNYREVEGFTSDEPPSAWSLLGWVPWCAAIAAGLWGLRSRSLPATSLGLGALALAPVLQWVPAGEVFAPRFLYAPLLLAVPFLARAARPVPRHLVAVALSALVLAAWSRAEVYSGRASYAEAVLRRAPGDSRAWNNLGLAYDEEGRPEAARDAWLRATELDPRYSKAWSNLGGQALEQGRLDAALPLLQRAVREGPKNPVAHVNLGQALRRSGDPEAAAQAYRRAATLAPGLAAAWSGLARCLEELGDAEGAGAAAERAQHLRAGT